MLDITKKYEEFKKSTHFTKLKAGGRFAIYSFGVYLVATFTVGYLGLMIGSPLLTFPLAMLISHPVIWIVMGVVLTAAYKMVVEPLFHLVKDYVNGKGTSKGEKSKEEGQKTPDRDSSIVLGSEPSSENSSRRSSNASLDSGLGSKEFHENLQTLVHQTNRGKYDYWLTNSDIEHIARVVYGYSDNNVDSGVYFPSPGCFNAKGSCLRGYKKNLDKNRELILTAILNTDKSHWTTLVIKYDSRGKKFKSYYCDSFGRRLPDDVLNIVKGELQKEGWTLDIRSSKTKQQKGSYNCGIFALENAHRITQMLKENKSFDEIDTELSKYKPNSRQLKKKRREFAEALMNDEKWKEDLAKGLLCDLPPGTRMSQSSASNGSAVGVALCNQ